MSKSKIYNSLLILFIPIFFASCASNSQNSIKTNEEKIDNNKKINECKPEVIVKIKEIIKQTPAKIIIKEKCTYPKMVIGQTEYAYIPSIKTTYKARVDTGATTTSIHALNIKEFERDGKRWVTFDLINNKTKINKQLPVARVINVKRHETKNQKRYVVKMRINLAKSSQVIDVSLTNRGNFKYPILIGRNFLNGVAIVDVARRYTSNPVKKEH